MEISAEAVEADKLLEAEMLAWYNDKVNVDVGTMFTFDNVKMGFEYNVARVFGHVYRILNTSRRLFADRRPGKDPLLERASNQSSQARLTPRACSYRDHIQVTVEPDIHARLSV